MWRMSAKTGGWGIFKIDKDIQVMYASLAVLRSVAKVTAYIEFVDTSPLCCLQVKLNVLTVVVYPTRAYVLVHRQMHAKIFVCL